MDDEKLNEAAEELADAVAAAPVVEDAPEVDELMGEVLQSADELPQEVETFDALVEQAVSNVEAEAIEELAAAPEPEPEPEPAPAPAPEPAPAPAPAPTPAPAAKPTGLAALGTPAWIGIACAALVIGLLLGRFALGGGSGAAASGSLSSATVSEAQLDDALATYSYNGSTQTITVRELIEQTGSLDAAKQEDGSYAIPSAEYAVQVARTQILRAEAESRGISVSDEDVAAYAEAQLGTSDMAALATAYNMGEEVVKRLLTENCLINALRDDVVGTDQPAMPEAPDSPEEGKESEKTEAYAKYIIELAGDEWDSKKNEWKAKDGPYATALADADFDKDGATYEAASSAYYVAYQKYSEAQSAITETWSAFENELMSKASIAINTLVM
jgi:hypothetical protein